MPKLACLIVLLAVAASSPAAPVAPVLRESPDFAISEPSGKVTMLSSFRGKVVVMEFLFLQSAHCMRVAQTLNGLYRELGPHGLQAVAVAFPAPGSQVTAALVSSTVEYFQLAYPVGQTSVQSVDAYLSRQKSEVLNIPQVVVIDRAGMIRARSGGRPGDPKLENEDSLRALLETLLRESPPTSPHAGRTTF